LLCTQNKSFMKLIFILFAGFFVSTTLFAQTPQSFSYQAVARDASGNALATKTVGLQLSILDGSATGTVVYVEKFNPATNNQGLFTVAVGTGIPVTGSFAAITWSAGNKYLKTELDPAGGSNYTIAGTSELLSVPYAFYAASTGSSGTSGSSPWVANGSTIVNTNSGGVGIATGSSTVQNQLQVGNTLGFDGNLLAMGNGSAVTSFAIESGTTTWYTNNNFSLMPAFSGTGNVGIGVNSPVNKLQIGSTPQFGGQDLAIGNGTQNMSLLLSPTAITWFSNVPFALMPSSGSGNVGIGVVPNITSSFKLTLQPNVNGSGILVQNGARTAFEAASGDLDIDNGNLNVTGAATIAGNEEIDGILTIVPLGLGNDSLTGAQAHLSAPGFTGQYPLSINASSGDVWGANFYATSDARAKNIFGTSDAAADLDKLNRIRVTDYTMKDTLTLGAHRYKKVIAQQVEEVYPQIIRKQKNFIPNVYQETAKMERVDSGYLLTFSGAHHLSIKATRLRVDVAGTVRTCSILSIPSGYEVLIKSPVLNATRAFVYGEEVDDFRTVDYEGLTTLNISATQELSKLVKEQADAIVLLKKQIRDLRARVNDRTPSALQPSTLSK
jgi:hypothetical protein